MASISAAELQEHLSFEDICASLRLGYAIEDIAQSYQTDTMFVQEIQTHFVKDYVPKPSLLQEGKHSMEVLVAVASCLEEQRADAALAPSAAGTSAAGTSAAGASAPLKIPKIKPSKGFLAVKSKATKAAAAGPKPRRVPQEERVRRYADGCCFYCGRPGHKKSDCLLLQAKLYKASKVPSAAKSPTASAMSVDEPKRFQRGSDSDSD